ncbi:major facilitator superfamily domain-containing protein [Hyaloraphidium curvatum]|nr:major facilitator superfamily domain-containing protein [Hyaloraphidium curvatum]
MSGKMDSVALDAAEQRMINNYWRALTFLGAVVSLLVSGTGYLAGLWTVQYASKVGYSQTEMASVGSVGFVVSALLAVPLGILGDLLPRPFPLLIFGGTAMFLGYFCLGGTYLGIVPHIHVAVSAFYVSLSATGNVATLQGALFTNVRNFSEKLRGLATGVPVSAIGLSAFFFTGVARLFFMVPVEETGPGTEGERRLDVGHFLVGVGVIGGLANAFGAATVHKVPLDVSETVPADGEQQPLVLPDPPPLEEEIEESDLAPIEEDTGAQVSERRIVTSFDSLDTWLWIYAKLALTGAGTMFIGNVGSIVLALAPEGVMPEDPALQRLQSVAVATISVGSCTGRILFGFLYDWLFRIAQTKRVTLFLFISCAMATLQYWFVIILRAGGAESLVVLTALMGTVYGGVAMSAPVVNSELFGTRFLAENYGAVMLFDAFANYFLNLLFGRVWDDNRAKDPSIMADTPKIVCHGPHCLLNTFVVTSAATTLAAVCMAILRWRVVRRDAEGIAP